jgi:hypothetical protein
LFPSNKYVTGSNARSPNRNGDSSGQAAPATSDPQLNIAGLLSDNNFRADSAQYIENLSWGKHDHEWLAEAQAAHDLRQAGEFRPYLRRKLKDDWGVEIPDEEEKQQSAENGRDSSEGEDGLVRVDGDGTSDEAVKDEESTGEKVTNEEINASEAEKSDFNFPVVRDDMEVDEVNGGTVGVAV